MLTVKYTKLGQFRGWRWTLFVEGNTSIKSGWAPILSAARKQSQAARKQLEKEGA